MNMIAVGDNTLDCYRDKRTMYPGGNALNVAVFSKRFGFDEAAYLGSVGTDTKGEWIMHALMSEGIDTSHVQRREGPNAHVTIELIEGERRFSGSFKGVSRNIILSDEDYDFISGFDIVHSSIFSNLENSLERLSCASKKLSFDFSKAYDTYYLKKYLHFMDYAFFSGAHLSERQLETLLREASSICELVCITRGERGAMMVYKNRLYTQETLSTNVLDTLGAGDAYIAATLVGVVRGDEPETIMANASYHAAQTCKNYGAFGYGGILDG